MKNAILPEAGAAEICLAAALQSPGGDCRHFLSVLILDENELVSCRGRTEKITARSVLLSNLYFSQEVKTRPSLGVYVSFSLALAGGAVCWCIDLPSVAI